MGYKTGFVAIIGKPNVGKSTLLNSFLGQKIAIVSQKPETTRDNIQGILTTSTAQIIFVDTPGIHRPHLHLGKLMVKKAESSLFGADLVLFVLDMTSGISSEDKIILNLLKDTKKPAIALINKVDAQSKSNALPIIDELKDMYDFVDIIPTSALKGDNMMVLLSRIKELLPEGQKLYPDSQITDKEDRFLAAEIIREKIFMLTRHEVPHCVAVVVDEMKERQDKPILDIYATIYVERDSQKGIIVGAKGRMAKEISTLSRQELEKKFGRKIFLRVWVKVLENWRQDPRALRTLWQD